MSKKWLCLVVGAALLAVCSGCASQVGIAPSTTPITAERSYTVIGPAKGSTFGFWLLWFPFFPPDSAGRARDEAIRRSGGDALIEVVQEYEVMTFFIVSFAWTNCYGTAVKIH